MKHILILSLLFPFRLMAMQEATQDKDAYFGIVTQLINSAPIAGGNDHLSPISENTLVYKKTIPRGYSVPLMEFVTSIDDLNPPQASRFINTSATQYNVYINNIVFSYPYDEPKITFTTTKSENGAMPTVIKKESIPLLLGCAYKKSVSYDVGWGIGEATFHRDKDGRLLKPSWSRNELDIQSISRREDLEKCPSRTINLIIAYLRMNKISTESGDAYILSEKQDIE